MAKNDDDDLEDIEPELEPSSGKGISLLIVIILLVVTAAGSGGGVYFFMPTGETEVKENANTKEEENKSSISDFFFKEEIFYAHLPDVSADLVTGRCASPSVRVQITLELTDKLSLGELKRLQPAAVDAVQLYLRNKTRKDLSGKIGAEKTRTDLLAVLRKRLAPMEIKGLLFKDFMLR